LSGNGHLELNERAWNLPDENGSMRYAAINHGRIEWTWKHGNLTEVDVAVSGVALLGAAARAATARTMKPSGAIANAHVGRLPEREMLSIACSQEELCADNRTQLVLFVPRYDLAALDKPQPLSRLHRVQRRAAPARLSIRGLNKFWLHDVDSRPPYSSLS